MIGSVRERLARRLRTSSEPDGLPHWFLDDLARFKELGGANGSETRLRIQPQLGDRTPTTAFDTHYTYQGVWAFRRLISSHPSTHVDVGSLAGYLGFFASVVPTTFVDIRPTEAQFEGLTEVKGSILNLPFADGSLESVSCLHVAEHVGLGRYGDPVDPEGMWKAARELVRVLAPGGNLYLSVPVGEEVVCFNAHRITAPSTILAQYAGLELIEFDAVLDDGTWRRNLPPLEMPPSAYACGMFWFRKPLKEFEAIAAPSSP
jgi:SAM-dependent methyltransferase